MAGHSAPGHKLPAWLAHPFPGCSSLPSTASLLKCRLVSASINPFLTSMDKMKNLSNHPTRRPLVEWVRKTLAETLNEKWHFCSGNRSEMSEAIYSQPSSFRRGKKKGLQDEKRGDWEINKYVA
ncbi:hypothetical protein CEXT_549621 [Caerostris extrusa]|uniref:Uncharacterized protein n=1 Tax=Caerostris extrusa TaxID=172846 RepID=A0AAV4Q562_CAEEX|nr:hypothetical protein CEXT_549621 [Caerostris extrusa]